MAGFRYFITTSTKNLDTWAVCVYATKMLNTKMLSWWHWVPDDPRDFEPHTAKVLWDYTQNQACLFE